MLYRQWINADGVSYLDLSDAIPTGDWNRLVSLHWSPLYPALIGLARVVLRAAAQWEFPVLHLVNFCCFLLALAAFEFFLRTISDAPGGLGERSTGLPFWAFQTIGYSLFLWASIGLLTLRRSQPDLLMSVFVYLSAAWIVRVRDCGGRLAPCVALGVSLGLGYLAKGAMFPLGVLLLGTILFFKASLREKVRSVTVAGIAFLAISLPFAWAVSREAHHVTFGESGTWNYLTFIDKVDAYHQKLGAARGRFVHPVLQLTGGEPAAYSPARPLAVTHSGWFDPGYWTEGVHPVLQWRRQAAVLIANLKLYAHLAFGLTGLALALLLLASQADRRLSLRQAGVFWPLYLLGVVALAAYAMIVVEDRYVGVFLVVGGTGLFGAFRFSRPVALRTVQIAVALVVLTLAVNGAARVRREYQENAWKTRLPNIQAAAALPQFGVEAGDPVASITPWVASGWARLARVRITAEVRQVDTARFWKAPPERQDAILRAFAASGCKAVVAWFGGPLPAGWQRLGPASSPYGVLRLSR